MGRALWGLETDVALAPGEGMRALARERFARALDALALKHPRALAYAICGLYNFLQHYDGAALVRRTLVEGAEQLAIWYERSYVEDHAASADAWRWFGDAMTYANAKMPQALLLAYKVTGTAHFRHIGLASLDFLLAETYHDGCLDFIGNQGWYRRRGARAILGQQPIEAGYTAEADLTAYDRTGEQRYLQLARAAAEWLLGRKRFSAQLYDLATSACADGLDPQGPSLNQGAQSMLYVLLTLLVVVEKCDDAPDEGGHEVVALTATPTVIHVSPMRPRCITPLHWQSSRYARSMARTCSCSAASIPIKALPKRLPWRSVRICHSISLGLCRTAPVMRGQLPRTLMASVCATWVRSGQSNALHCWEVPMRCCI